MEPSPARRIQILRERVLPQFVPGGPMAHPASESLIRNVIAFHEALERGESPPTTAGAASVLCAGEPAPAVHRPNYVDPSDPRYEADDEWLRS